MREDGWRARIRWVVVHPDQEAVLVDRRDGAGRLPQAERPGQVWTADPAEILPGLRDLLGADAVLLRCLEEDEDETARVQRATLVAVPRAVPALPEGLAWAGPAELAAGGDGDSALAARVATDLATGGTGVAGRPWAARGWFAAAERWLRESMAAIGRPVSGPVAQHRTWELSCILRAPTATGDVWFKTSAALPLLINEGVVLSTLSELFGDRVPVPLAVEPELGWVVLDDVGQEVGWSASFEGSRRWPAASPGCRSRSPARPTGCWPPAATTAPLTGWPPRPRPGCHRSRPPATCQASTTPPGCRRTSWRRSGPPCRRCWPAAPSWPASPSRPRSSTATCISATWPGGRGGYRFFDWTDACVAHPFLDLATIRRGTSFAEDRDGRERKLRARLQAAYLPEWAAFETPERLDRAFQLAAPLGALHQAVSYRSIVASQQPPIDVHMSQSTAWWLRQVLAGLADLGPPP